MLPSDIRNLQEAYQNIYEESDLLTNDLIEEIVEELVEECVEFGYNLEESVAAVEAAAILYIDEAKVTYGSDTESPEERSTRAKDRLGDRKASARKAAVKDAVSKVKSKAAGAAVSGYVAAKAAKSAVSGAVSAVKRAPAAVSAAAKQKKAEVKGGIKKMIGGGLRAAAGGLGKIAKKAAGAASRFGESVELDENRAMARDPEGRKSGHSKQPDPSKPGFTGIGNMSIAQIAKMSAKIGKDKKQNEEYVGEAITSEKGKAKAAEMIAARSTPSGRAKSGQGANVAQIRQIRGSGRGDFDREGLGGTPMTPTMAKNPIKKQNYTGTGNKAARRAGTYQEEVEIYDIVLEYLMSEGHADTIAEAEYIMTELDSEMVDQIVETRLDPRGRPASGPMNVYANPKNKPSQAHLDAVKAYDAAQKKKTPEQRKAELDAYKERQMNR
jgi:hypothetical protein